MFDKYDKNKMNCLASSQCHDDIKTTLWSYGRVHMQRSKFKKKKKKKPTINEQCRENTE